MDSFEAADKLAEQLKDSSRPVALVALSQAFQAECQQSLQQLRRLTRLGRAVSEATHCADLVQDLLAVAESATAHTRLLTDTATKIAETAEEEVGIR